METNSFLQDLDSLVEAKLGRIGAASAGAAPDPNIGVRELLTTALKKELEASEEAALWMVGESDVEVKLALARQCGDEAKHYRLIEARLKELGVNTSALAPLSDGYSPMFKFLKSLETTVERVAAGQYAREALAKVYNNVFIEFCVSKGDEATAALYRDVIQPDEGHHHELGRKLLIRLATTADDQQKARKAAERTLEIAEEIQEMVRLKKGISCAPGC
ncbi:MAG: ferritin-like domain-containing protein [Polyangiaceae bacterium]|nr:ferritin-like domain-containing protein [Polyangiaceae bacterium]